VLNRQIAFPQLDNRWPGLIWNQTNQTQAGTSCTGVPVNFAITSNRSGEANQNFSNVAIGGRRNIRMRYDAIYTITTTSADAQRPFTQVGQASGPGGPELIYAIDAKKVYRGVSAWVHIVLFRQENDSSCGTNLQAPNLAGLNAESMTQTILFNNDVVISPVDKEKRGF
jgi:hypothetical protein